LDYLSELLVEKRIEPEDFRNMKFRNAVKIDKLDSQLAKLNSEKIDIDELLTAGIDNLLKLEYAYEITDMDKKREIIVAVCPDKIYIENGALRTFRVNEIIRLIWQKDSELQKNKKGQNKTEFTLSSVVGVAGFEPTTSCSQSRRDTGLRYTPRWYHLYYNFLIKNKSYCNPADNP
jgi:hypothetical protein